MSRYNNEEIVEKTKWCCEPFKKALWTNNFTIDSDNNIYYIEGYDMDGEYPPLEYCPTCGFKLSEIKLWSNQ